MPAFHRICDLDRNTNALEILRYGCRGFMHSDKKSDFTSDAQSLCSITLRRATVLNRERTMYREHPFKIVKHAIKNIWLLIFPLFRAVRSLTLDFDAFYHWLSGIWIDLIIVIIMIAFGYFRWLFTFYRPGRNHIHLTTGVFIKTRSSIAYDRISAVTAESSFWLMPFRAVRLRISTRAKNFNAGDMSLLVPQKQLISIYRKLPKLKMDSPGERSLDLRPKWYAMLLYSLAFSSSLSGVIYIGALVVNTWKMISEPARENMNNFYRIASNVSENVSERTALSIPPAIIIIIGILAATWLLSFLSNILRYCGFNIVKDKVSLRVSTGVLTKRTFLIYPEKINYIDLRQNFLMKLFGIYSVNINCSGYGTSRLENPVLIPMLTRSKVNRLLEHLDIDMKLHDRETKPEPLAFWSYISQPIYIMILMLAADFITLHFFPKLTEAMMFIIVMQVIPVFWFVIVKTAAFFTTGIAFRDNYCCVRWSRFLAFHTILAYQEKLVKIQVFQDVLDEKFCGGRSRLDLYFSSEKPRVNKIKGLKKTDAERVIREFETHSKT